MALQLHYWEYSYPLEPDVCPCDVHFIEYLQDNNITNKAISHFGTGEHHILGKNNLCELYDQEKSACAVLNDSSLIALFLSKLNPGGRIFFYKGSFAFRKVQILIENFVSQNQMVKVDKYKTLVAYGQPLPSAI